MGFLQTNMKWLFTNQWWIVSFPWLTEACPENISYVKYYTFGMDGWTFRNHNWLFSSKKKIIWVSKHSNVPSCQSLRKVFDFFRGGGGQGGAKNTRPITPLFMCVVFVWLVYSILYDCIMTASWLHPDCILTASPHWFVWFKHYEEESGGQRNWRSLLQTTDSTFTFRNSKPFQRTWLFSIPRPNSSEVMGLSEIDGQTTG